MRNYLEMPSNARINKNKLVAFVVILAVLFFIFYVLFLSGPFVGAAKSLTVLDIVERNTPEGTLYEVSFKEDPNIVAIVKNQPTEENIARALGDPNIQINGLPENKSKIAKKCDAGLHESLNIVSSIRTNPFRVNTANSWMGTVYSYQKDGDDWVLFEIVPSGSIPKEPGVEFGPFPGVVGNQQFLPSIVYALQGTEFGPPVGDPPPTDGLPGGGSRECKQDILFIKEIAGIGISNPSSKHLFEKVGQSVRAKRSLPLLTLNDFTGGGREGFTYLGDLKDDKERSLGFSVIAVRIKDPNFKPPPLITWHIGKEPAQTAQYTMPFLTNGWDGWRRITYFDNTPVNPLDPGTYKNIPCYRGSWPDFNTKGGRSSFFKNKPINTISGAPVVACVNGKIPGVVGFNGDSPNPNIKSDNKAYIVPAQTVHEALLRLHDCLKKINKKVK